MALRAVTKVVHNDHDSEKEEEDGHTEETHESEDNEEDEMEKDDDDSDYSEELKDHDDDDASYYMESSFRSHSTHSSTPASPLRLEFGGVIPTHLLGQMILLLQPPE